MQKFKGIRFRACVYVLASTMKPHSHRNRWNSTIIICYCWHHVFVFDCLWNFNTIFSVLSEFAWPKRIVLLLDLKQPAIITYSIRRAWVLQAIFRHVYDVVVCLTVHQMLQFPTDVSLSQDCVTIHRMYPDNSPKNQLPVSQFAD